MCQTGAEGPACLPEGEGSRVGNEHAARVLTGTAQRASLPNRGSRLSLASRAFPCDAAVSSAAGRV